MKMGQCAFKARPSEGKTRVLSSIRGSEQNNNEDEMCSDAKKIAALEEQLRQKVNIYNITFKIVPMSHGVTAKVVACSLRRLRFISSSFQMFCSPRVCGGRNKMGTCMI